MSKQKFFQQLGAEVARIDTAHTTKRQETIIEGFTFKPSPRALIDGKPFLVFNSNDYLGLRLNPKLIAAEHQATEQYGTGPGAVRFISGALKVHRELEKALAKFHDREDSMIFSSAFATNMAVLFSLLKGQSKDSLVDNSVIVISDELNHRSIIDGIRIANLGKEQKAIFKHMNADHLREVLQTNLGQFKRALVVTDGVFSMLGEYQDLSKIRAVINEFDNQYELGVLLVVDDAHGVGAFGKTGRGTEEMSTGQADVLVGTMGKAFGADGGYVVGPQAVIDYLRESAATYIYSNNIAPGTAGAALAGLELLATREGKQILKTLSENIIYFKTKMLEIGFQFAAPSNHPIQAVLIGDTAKTKELKQSLFKQEILVTNINYPVVPPGKDEIRVQISAAHTRADINQFLKAIKIAGQQLKLI
ncbi:MAG TPA: aminotransferase class I/II-fold pyridoxal phosphate-dependent enzyme [Patescibacteria group bacterium]|jgi:glycine C-acetyltransferase